LASAKQGPNLYSNFAGDAGYLSTAISHQDYVSREGTALCTIPGFHLSFVFFDILHTIHLGIGQDIAGSVMSLLCKFGWYGAGDTDVQLKRCWLRFKRWRRNHALDDSIEVFSSKMLGRSGSVRAFAVLGTKAHKNKVILFYLAAEALAFSRWRPGEVPNRIARCVWGICAFLRAVDEAGMFLTPSEVDAATRAGTVCCHQYVWLATWGMTNAEAVFRIRPKLHYFHHMVLSLGKLPNPKLGATWLDEDFVGQAVGIAAATHTLSLPWRFLERYRLLLWCRWQRGLGP